MRPRHKALLEMEKSVDQGGPVPSQDELVDAIADVFGEILTDRPGDISLADPLSDIARICQRLANMNKALIKEYQILQQQIHEVRTEVAAIKGGTPPRPSIIS